MKSPTTNLTNRQIECLFNLVKGKTMRQIAVQMGLSHRTVEHYLETIKAKLHCKTRGELIEKAFTIKVIRDKLLMLAL